MADENAISIDFRLIATYLGELYASAFYDAKTASADDVSLDGIPIRAWRKAYLEGCKDMVEGILTRVPDGAAKSAVMAAFKAHHRALSEPKP